MNNRLECGICFSKLEHFYTINNMPMKLSCVESPDLTTENMSFSICQ